MPYVVGLLYKILKYLNESNSSVTKDDLVEHLEEFEEPSVILGADRLTELGYVKMTDGFGRNFIISITDLGKQVLQTSIKTNRK